VRDESAVRVLATRAVERYGAVHVWVNSAGVIAYGRFEAVPSDVFRAQRSGVLVNLSSVWGRVTTPDVSAYSISKFAVRALGECLREELRDLPDVGVATILPQAVDTPIFDHAANYSGRPVRPIPPLVDPWLVAEGIVRCARSPRRDVTYRRAGRMLERLHDVAPGIYARLLGPAFEAGNYGAGDAPPTSGNVLEPLPGPRDVSGHWRRDRRRQLAGALLDTIGGLVRGVRGR
jgi:NAD(P)-dependent dehydrogenase (short-subunit alcohol dehydrogenase family)